MDYAAAILHCRPGALWSCGDTYASIQWMDSVLPKPTEEELQQAWLDYLAQAQFELQNQAAKDTKLAQAKALVEAGYSVQPEGFTLALGDNDRSQFTQMLTLVQEALSLGLITNETPQTIADKDGGKHTVSTLRLRQILVLYGLHYKGIWDAATTS